tara:strand:- start:1214 stop:1462 length:249 start_codon:yes stop_codon:yes gene_type:complete
MTLKEFILNNKIEKIEYLESTIFSVVCSGVPYGLDVDTSKIKVRKKVISTEDFLLDEKNLTFGKIILDLEKTELLGEHAIVK